MHRTSHLTSRALSGIRRSSPIRAYADQSTKTTNWKGRGIDENPVRQQDDLNAQHAASKTAMQEKEKGDELSQATSQSDHRSSNARAKEESPKAPGPVIGMNDERGGKGY
ncbi:MAG: hypothetical protein M1824_001939 [Vezdaea acicularis]|nr:MAG: hypothetical protein M1824_001939 [Vezdaea acicularis]